MFFFGLFPAVTDVYDTKASESDLWILCHAIKLFKSVFWRHDYINLIWKYTTNLDENIWPNKNITFTWIIPHNIFFLLNKFPLCASPHIHFSVWFDFWMWVESQQQHEKSINSIFIANFVVHSSSHKFWYKVTRLCELLRFFAFSFFFRVLLCVWASSVYITTNVFDEAMDFRN